MTAAVYYEEEHCIVVLNIVLFTLFIFSSLASFFPPVLLRYLYQSAAYDVSPGAVVLPP